MAPIRERIAATAHLHSTPGRRRSRRPSGERSLPGMSCISLLPDQPGERHDAPRFPPARAVARPIHGGTRGAGTGARLGPRLHHRAVAAERAARLRRRDDDRERAHHRLRDRTQPHGGQSRPLAAVSGQPHQCDGDNARRDARAHREPGAAAHPAHGRGRRGHRPCDRDQPGRRAALRVETGVGHAVLRRGRARCRFARRDRLCAAELDAVPQWRA